MATINYQCYENKKTGTHSFYARPVFKSTLTMDELLEEALGNTSIEASIGRAAITEFMRTVQREVQRGNRCQLGDKFLTIYPTLELSVKDHQNAKGEEVVATAKMLDAGNAYSRLGCTVHPSFSKQFAQNVRWRKVDRDGNALDPEEEEGNDIVDDPNANLGGDNANQGGDDFGGGNNPPSGGDGGGLQ